MTKTKDKKDLSVCICFEYIKFLANFTLVNMLNFYFT